MAGSGPVAMAVIPEVPRADEPIICTFKLNNPASVSRTIDFSFYANGELLQHGTSTLEPQTSKTYQYVYKNPLALGEQVNFVVRAETDGGRCEKGTPVDKCGSNDKAHLKSVLSATKLI